MGLIVLGLQQSSVWGWGSPRPGHASSCGAITMVAFVLVGAARGGAPAAPADLPRPRLLGRQRGPAADVVRVRARTSSSPASTPRCRSAKDASEAGVYLLYFFLGFVVLAQIGGRILDRRGARPAVVLGSAMATVGFWLLANKLPDLSLSAQKCVDPARGRRGRVDARAGQHRRRQQGPQHQLQRGHRDHPDGQELRRQPRPRRARGDPDRTRQDQCRQRVARPRGSRVRAPSTSPRRSVRPAREARRVAIPRLPTRSGWRRRTRPARSFT